MVVSIDLSGRVILVCGAARGGISGATCRTAAAAGATVVGVDLTQDLLDATRADIEKAGGKFHGIVANLMDSAQSDTVVATALKLAGRLDGVANVAGGTRADEWQPLEDTSLQSWRDTLNLNLEYVFRICRDAAKSWITRDVSGALVNVTSVSALTSAPFHGPYGAAKSGIAALTRTMAFEWGGYGIRANSVAPGAVPSDRVMKRTTTTAPSPKTSGSSDVIFTSMQEMANVIVFLLSDLASGITGQNVAVDSGLSTKFCGGSRPHKVLKRNPQV